MPVNKERLALGIAALRSDEFEQCEGSLRDVRYNVDESVAATTYCCLGVLTEVAVRNGLVISDFCVVCEDPVDGCDHPDYTSSVWQLNHSTLAAPVIKWYGFDSEDPYIGSTDPEDGVQDLDISATFANDESKWTFSEIADGFERVYMHEDSA